MFNISCLFLIINLKHSSTVTAVFRACEFPSVPNAVLRAAAAYFLWWKCNSWPMLEISQLVWIQLGCYFIACRRRDGCCKRRCRSREPCLAVAYVKSGPIVLFSSSSVLVSSCCIEFIWLLNTTWEYGCILSVRCIQRRYYKDIVISKCYDVT